MTTTTLSALESHLWEAANILRGSPVDRTDWKSNILPLMFFKRICDVWDEEYEEAVKTYGEDFADEHRFMSVNLGPQYYECQSSTAILPTTGRRYWAALRFLIQKSL